MRIDPDARMKFNDWVRANRKHQRNYLIWEFARIVTTIASTVLLLICGGGGLPMRYSVFGTLALFLVVMIPAPKRR